MAKKAIEEKIGPFEADPVACGVCNKQPATHQISISVRRGFEYSTSKQLYHVDYSVCGGCAKDAVTVQIGAQLNLRDKR